MKIREVNENKKQFISLLLLADEQENMIDRYLEKGTMYALEDGNVKAECVVTDEGNEIFSFSSLPIISRTTIMLLFYNNFFKFKSCINKFLHRIHSQW